MEDMKMKKILTLGLILLLVISLLGACGGKSGDGGNGGNEGVSGGNAGSIDSVDDDDDGEDVDENGNGDSDEPAEDSVYPSQLLHLSDVGSILGEEMLDNESVQVDVFIEDSTAGRNHIIGEYFSDEYKVAIRVEQESLFTGFSKSQGMAEIIELLVEYRKTEYSGQTITKIDGLGEGAYLISPLNKIGEWKLEFFQGEFLITIMLDYQYIGPLTMTRENQDEEMAWREDKLLQLGELAAERLQEIIENR
jgi:hypothetical protein